MILYKDKQLLMNRVIRLTAGMLEFHLRIITIPDSIMQKIGKMLLCFLMSRMWMALSLSPMKSIWKTILSPAYVIG